MTRNGLRVLLAGLFLLFISLSLSSAAFLAAALMLLVTLLYSLLSVSFSRHCLHVRFSLDIQEAARGDTVMAQILPARLHAALPVGACTASLALPDGTLSHLILHAGEPVRIPLFCRHVGLWPVGVRNIYVHDLFGLWQAQLPVPPAVELLVRPVPFSVPSLAFAPGENGLGTMANATEDLSSPSDVRAYMHGDPLKKIHWKLSARRQELVVRRFDAPIYPQALMLLNTRLPENAGRQSADLNDALMETCASCLLSCRAQNETLLFPLYATPPMLLSTDLSEQVLLNALARAKLDASASFPQMMALESRRLRTSGATLIVSSCLSGDMVEEMLHLRKLGPSLRLYLVTATPDNPDLTPFIVQLQDGLCEVCFVTPQPTMPEASSP